MKIITKNMQLLQKVEYTNMKGNKIKIVKPIQKMGLMKELEERRWINTILNNNKTHKFIN